MVCLLTSFAGRSLRCAPATGVRAPQLNTKLLAVLLFAFSALAQAGDLDVLPETDGAFREKVGVFIKSGSKVKDAVSLLESSRFKCEELKEHKSTVWCQRTDGNSFSSVLRRYQVTLETDGALVKQIQTSTGLVGT